MLKRYLVRLACLSALVAFATGTATAQQPVLAHLDTPEPGISLAVVDAAPAEARRIAAEAAAASFDGVLTPAHPNPFNPRTSVTLTLDAPERVVVAVYNMLGRPVDVLYDGEMPASTPTTFTFDAGALPSGLYLFHVQGETFVATRQALLLK